MDFCTAKTKMPSRLSMVEILYKRYPHTYPASQSTNRIIPNHPKNQTKQKTEEKDTELLFLYLMVQHCWNLFACFSFPWKPFFLLTLSLLSSTPKPALQQRLFCPPHSDQILSSWPNPLLQASRSRLLSHSNHLHRYLQAGFLMLNKD